MSLMHAILGFLTIESMTGYDLKTQCFDTTVAHFWSADQAQIYRTLDKLAEDGFVTSAITYQSERPNRKLYTITDTGRRELYAWLNQSQGLPTHREPFLIQLYFAQGLPKARVLELMAEQRQLHRERLAVYESIPLPPSANIEADSVLLYPRFTLEMGILLEKTYITWLDTCMERLKAEMPKQG